MNFIDIKIHSTTIKTWTAVSYHLGCEEMRLLLCCGILGMKTWLLLAVVYVCEQVWEGWQGPIPTGYCADGLTICGLSECCGTRYEGWLSLQWESQLSHIPLWSSLFGMNISTHVWKRQSTEKQQCCQNNKQFQTQQQCIHKNSYQTLALNPLITDMHNKCMNIQTFLLRITNVCTTNTEDKNFEIYRVSQEECARLREGVPYVKVYQYNQKHLYPKLNGYGDNGQRKVGASCGSKYCNLHSWYVMWQC